MTDYDVIVLGGGSAGTAAAAAAAAAGARAAMINRGELGGLCILRGCMPTKALLASAHAIHEANHLEPFGATLEGRTRADFARIMQRKDAQVARFKQAKVDVIESAGYEVIEGTARFAPSGGLDVDGRRLTAKRYVIATGSVPVHLPIPGLERVPVLTSDDVMRLETQPKALLVQGAGPIGLELSQFFARIGTEVLLVNRSPLLSKIDPEAGEELERALRNEPRFELAAPGNIEELFPHGKGLLARIGSADGEREFRADALLMAAGRRADLDDLGLEQVGLRPVDGLLAHDDAMRTSNPSIFVAGDASGTDQILHVANMEGRTAGHNAAAAEPPRRIDRRLPMNIVFTDPPFATVGLTEAEARKKDGELRVARARFPETGRAITMGADYGLWKLFVGREGRLLGSAILGPRADDLIHLISLMMHHGTRIEELPELPWYHPTLSEVLLTLARDLARD